MDLVVPLGLQRRCFRWTRLFDWATGYEVTHAGDASLSQYVGQYTDQCFRGNNWFQRFEPQQPSQGAQ